MGLVILGISCFEVDFGFWMILVFDFAFCLVRSEFVILAFLVL